MGAKTSCTQSHIWIEDFQPQQAVGEREGRKGNGIKYVITAMGARREGMLKAIRTRWFFQEKPEAVKRGKDADPDEQAVAPTEQRQAD